MSEFWTTTVRNSLACDAVGRSGVTDRETVKAVPEIKSLRVSSDQLAEHVDRRRGHIFGGRREEGEEGTYLRVRRPSEGANGHCMGCVGDG